MKVFISWSGDYSKGIALALNEFLPQVIQAFKPWMSSESIRFGNRWLIDLAGALDDTNFGILCVTRDNMNAPWLTFEAGALGKKVKNPETGVVGLLFDMTPSDLSGPLTQFHNTPFSKEAVRKLVKEMNLGISEPVGEKIVDRAFEAAWPDLERQVEALKRPAPTPKEARKSDRDLLEEAVELMRKVNANINPTPAAMSKLFGFIRRQQEVDAVSRATFAKLYDWQRLVGMPFSEVLGAVRSGALTPEEIERRLLKQSGSIADPAELAATIAWLQNQRKKDWDLLT